MDGAPSYCPPTHHVAIYYARVRIGSSPGCRPRFSRLSAREAAQSLGSRPSAAGASLSSEHPLAARSTDGGPRHGGGAGGYQWGVFNVPTVPPTTVKERDTMVTVQAESGVGGKMEVKISEIAARAVEVDNAALDSILSLNSFFCVAIFIGISLPAQQGAAQASADRAAGDNPEPRGPCALHDPEATRQTVLMLEIVAFACVLLSTLLAVGLKLVLNMNSNRSEGGDARTFQKPGQAPEESGNGGGSLSFFRFIMFLAAAALVSALVLLCISMVFYVELYAGRITCSALAKRSTVPLIVLTALGLSFLILVLILFIKFAKTTLLQISNRLKKTLGMREKMRSDRKDVESLLPPAVP